MSVLDVPTDDVTTYAAAVRRALVGLTAEQVEDLTDDLEADLADALADEERGTPDTGLTGLFGTPEAYAAELRAAAGLAAPTTTAAPGLRAALAERRRRARARLARAVAPLRAAPWWPGVAAFGEAVRPLWWAVRGWVLCQLVLALSGQDVRLAPRDAAELLLLVALVVLSVQWGRGLWRSGRLTRFLARFAQVVAVVAVIPVLGSAASGSTEYVYQDGGYYEPQAGVYVDGRSVGNLFVYDADGQPVVGAQVYDEHGQPVVAEPAWDDTGRVTVPGEAADGSERWNAYPRPWVPWDGGVDELGQPVPSGPAEDATWPFAAASPLTSPRPEPEPSGAASPASTPAPSATPSTASGASPEPAASPSPEATPTP